MAAATPPRSGASAEARERVEAASWALWWRRFEARARAPVDALSLAVFRVLLGALVVIAVARHWAKGGIYDAFVVPTHFFAYDGLSFVRPLPGFGMYVVYAALAIASASLALGLRSRISAAIACVLFTYAHACDKTNYLNHYYLVSLLLGLAAVLPLGSVLSIDAYRRGARRASVPSWVLWLVRFQVGLVYFYGGVGKLQSDWLLEGMPLRIWLAANGDFPVLGPILRWPETPYVMSWLGAIFDLSVAFLLSIRRTRPFAYACVVFFHVVTSRLFQIGMFPWVMISLTLVFFDPSWPRRFFPARVVGASVPPESERLSNRALERARWPRFALGLAIVWAAFHVLFPLRSHLFPGDVLWTEDGYRFSWRVMLIEKAGSAEFTATDPITGASRDVRVRALLTPFQVKMMSTQPDMIRAFAWMVADEAERRGEPRPRVTADVFVTLNGRPATRFVDPTIDLAATRASFGKTPWVLPSPR